MCSAFHALRAGIATAISLWMGVLACFMGCTLPVLASPGTHDSSTRQVAAESQPARMSVPMSVPMSGPMASMENCPHHSGGSAPTKPADGKSAPDRMSCCPLEITIGSKPDSSALAIALAQDFVPASHFPLQTVRIYSSVEPVPSVFHSGRDTLLKTRLLRV
jgi:hypothetical protein